MRNMVRNMLRLLFFWKVVMHPSCSNLPHAENVCQQSINTGSGDLGVFGPPNRQKSNSGHVSSRALSGCKCSLLDVDGLPERELCVLCAAFSVFIFELFPDSWQPRHRLQPTLDGFQLAYYDIKSWSSRMHDVLGLRLPLLVHDKSCSRKGRIAQPFCGLNWWSLHAERKSANRYRSVCHACFHC